MKIALHAQHSTGTWARETLRALRRLKTVATGCAASACLMGALLSAQAQAPQAGSASAATSNAGATSAAPATSATAPSAASPAIKTLRFAFPIAETGFDPAQVSDLYSNTVNAGIFETLVTFDYLARPFKLVPMTAELPTVSADFTEFTFKIKPGTYFADDPAFKGKRRELTAQDYVYSIKRHYDPTTKSPNLYRLENAKLLGLSELRKKASADKTPFPYDTEVEGVKALDRYTLRFKLAEPSPRFPKTVLADVVYGAVAREVVEFYGDKIMAHPVGTGPFRLAEWRRSAKITLERNPNYREVFYNAQPAADDATGQAIAAQLRGRRLPMVDRVEIAIIEEDQPRWLSFLNNEMDVMDRLPNKYADQAVPNNHIAPYLKARGVHMNQSPLVDASIAAFFNMEHPVVGGNTPDKVALRRAISLAYNTPLEVNILRRKQAITAQTPIAPLVYGYNPTQRTLLNEYNPSKARALLDLYGYVDRDGDGWRDLPDGKPLVLEMASQPDQLSNEQMEIWAKSAKAVGIKMVFKIAKWPENLKASKGGKLMMWHVGWSGGNGDGDTYLALGYGPNKGGANSARFDLPAFNALYEKQQRMPDGPERFEVMQQAAKLMIAYMPYKVSLHRILTDLMQPWVTGYQRNPFVREFFVYTDIDLTMLPEAARQTAARDAGATTAARQ